MTDIVITANAATKLQYESELRRYGGLVRVILGGETRKDSVQMGVNALQSCDTVMIHDGARPFVSQALIQRLLQAAKTHAAVIPEWQFRIQ